MLNKASGAGFVLSLVKQHQGIAEERNQEGRVEMTWIYNVISLSF